MKTVCQNSYLTVYFPLLSVGVKADPYTSKAVMFHTAPTQISTDVLRHN